MLKDPANCLLTQMEPGLARRFSSRLQRVHLPRAAILQEPGAEVQFVYFPETAVLAAGAETLAGEMVNVDLVGREGVFGALEACGSRYAFAQLSVLIAGDVWRIAAQHYREMFDACASIRTAVHKHTEQVMVETRQLVACNALHPVENRLSRALLDLLDRGGGETRLPVTQEAVAQILGVQRTTVAVALAGLQRAGGVKTGRGMVEVTDVPSLRRTACSCRDTVTFARREIYGARWESCDT